MIAPWPYGGGRFSLRSAGHAKGSVDPQILGRGQVGVNPEDMDGDGDVSHTRAAPVGHDLPAVLDAAHIHRATAVSEPRDA